MDFERKSFFGKLSIVKCFLKLLRKKHKKQKNEIKEVEEEVTHIEELDDEILDWWTKYYNSLDPIVVINLSLINYLSKEFNLGTLSRNDET